jgi:hypothetical protein
MSKIRSGAAVAWSHFCVAWMLVAAGAATSQESPKRVWTVEATNLQTSEVQNFRFYLSGKQSKRLLPSPDGWRCDFSVDDPVSYGSSGWTQAVTINCEKEGGKKVIMADAHATTLAGGADGAGQLAIPADQSLLIRDTSGGFLYRIKSE